MRWNRPAAGFTLLEMVIAISIFSIVAVIAYGGLTGFLNSYEHIAAREERIKALQSMFTQLERDLRFFAARSVRDEYGDEEPAFIARVADPPIPGEIMRLTVYQPDGRIPRINRLQRVAWRFDDADLYRVNWKVLDRAQDSTEYRRRILRGVSEIAVRYLTYGTQNDLVSSDEWDAAAAAPSGIEVLVVLDNGERYRRVFEVYDGA
jgi:general secretion pathway protein J